jgi:NAD(P)-dependent dehydrogenase (short-subunit alcohol dehydrogenase family)
MQIRDIAAIVTGGASGLGYATARRLAEEGAKVAVFDLNEKSGKQAAEDIGGVFFKVNVAEEASVVAGLDAATSVHGVARILVNCAGIARSAKTVGKEHVPHSLDAYRQTIEVNLIGTFSMISKFAARTAATGELEEERAVIVNTASIAAFDGQVGQAAYAAAKGGIVGMTLPIARDLAPLRIRVMTIAPGIFLTPMLESLPQQVQDSLGAQVPHPSRLGKPSEFAQLVESIVRNPMLNGEVIRLDGAMRMAPR